MNKSQLSTFKQKIKITIIYISYKFYLQKNDVDIYTTAYQLSSGHNRTRKLLLTCRDLPTVAVSYHVKIRENY